jgi:Zn-dependent M16 (insulinase) family peptidase
MLQAFRNGILEVNQKQLSDVAQLYLQQGFAGSAVGILAGDEMFNKAKKALQQMNMQEKRLGSQ